MNNNDGRFDFNEFFGSLFNTNGYDSEEDESSDVELIPSVIDLVPMAKTIKNLYDSFIKVGFRSDTAERMVLNIILSFK